MDVFAIEQQLEEALSREEALRKINHELTKIIQNTQISQYAQLLTRINQMEVNHAKQLDDMRLKISRQQSQHAFVIKQRENLQSDVEQRYDQIRTQNEFLKAQLHRKNEKVEKLTQQIKKYKKMVRNQQNLLDSFKKSIDQQVLLEKQVLKSTYKEKEATLKNNFQKIIQDVQEGYEKKMINISKQNKQNCYKNELKNLGKYLSITGSVSGSKTGTGPGTSSGNKHNSNKQKFYGQSSDFNQTSKHKKNNLNQNNNNNNNNGNNNNFQSTPTSIHNSNSNNIFSHQKPQHLPQKQAQLSYLNRF